MLHNVLLTDYAWADLDIERAVLRAAGADLTIAEKQDAASLANLAADCDAIMTNWAKVPETVIAAAPKCKIIARLGIGLDNIDVAAATRRGIVVTNVPDYCIVEVAEHALALMLIAVAQGGVLSCGNQGRSGTTLQAGPRAAADRRPNTWHRRAGKHRHPFGEESVSTGFESVGDRASAEKSRVNSPAASRGAI